MAVWVSPSLSSDEEAGRLLLSLPRLLCVVPFRPYLDVLAFVVAHPDLKMRGSGHFLPCCTAPYWVPVVVELHVVRAVGVCPVKGTGVVFAGHCSRLVPPAQLIHGALAVDVKWRFWGLGAVGPADGAYGQMPSDRS